MATVHDDDDTLLDQFDLIGDDDEVVEATQRANGTEAIPDGLLPDDDDDEDTIGSTPRAAPAARAAKPAESDEYDLGDYVRAAQDQLRAHEVEVANHNQNVESRRQGLRAIAEAKTSRIEVFDDQIARLSANLEQARAANNADATFNIQAALQQVAGKRSQEISDINGLAKEYQELQPVKWAPQPGGDLAQAFLNKHSAWAENPHYRNALMLTSQRIGTQIPATDVRHYAEVEREMARFFPELGIRTAAKKAAPAQGQVAVASYTRQRPGNTTARSGESGGGAAAAPAGKIPLSAAQIASAKMAGLWDDPKKRAAFLRNVKATQARG